MRQALQNLLALADISFVVFLPVLTFSSCFLFAETQATFITFAS